MTEYDESSNREWAGSPWDVRGRVGTNARQLGGQRQAVPTPGGRVAMWKECGLWETELMESWLQVLFSGLGFSMSVLGTTPPASERCSAQG